MKKTVTIGLMGLSFCSSNLGCVALAKSFYIELTKLLESLNINAELIAIGKGEESGTYKNNQYPIRFVDFHLSKISTLFAASRALSECDVIFDFTEGDSFSDIYGRGRFYRSTILKALMENKKKKLVLGPQTYGPYSHFLSRKIAKRIIEKADKIYSRDEQSVRSLGELGVKKEVIVSTDVAFRLPYSKQDKRERKGHTNIGINVSGLLWDDAENKTNKLGLTVDYIQYCKLLTEHLCKNPSNKVYLIPHVGTKIDSAESDYAACYKLKKENPDSILLEGFVDPISAKTELAKMDIVIAARMHASIGAFSSGVFTIPFAYSRKFQGYYEQLQYPVLVDGKTETTKDAVNNTLEYIANRNNYETMIAQSHTLAEKTLDDFYSSIATILSDIAQINCFQKGE